MSDEFRAFIHTGDEGRIVFQQAMAHARALVDNGERVQVVVGPALEPISIRQRKFLKDIVCGQIAEQAFVGERRERFTKAIWAEFFRERFLGSRWEMQKMPGQKRATPRRVRISTETLGVRAYSEHTNKVIDHATVELDVVFHFTRDEQELRQPAKRKKKEVREDEHADRSAAG